MEWPHVALSPDILFQIGELSIKNSYITFSLLTGISVLFLIYIARNFSVKPSKIQIIFEELYSFFAEKISMTNISEKQKKSLLSIVLTLFIIIFLSNFFSVAPILSSILYSVSDDVQVPIFRTPTSDFSLTIALWVFVVIGANLVAFSLAPLRYVGNFIKIQSLLRIRSLKDVWMWLLDFFLGIMDIISEWAKVISISARLFGNIIAGEIIAVVMIFLLPYFIPIPFFILSLFSGLIQAFVFALLSMQFIAWSLENVRSSEE